MPQAKYRKEGDQIKFDSDAVKMRLGGFWIMAANRVVTQMQFEQLKNENPTVEFVAIEPPVTDLKEGSLSILKAGSHKAP